MKFRPALNQRRSTFFRQHHRQCKAYEKKLALFIDRINFEFLAYFVAGKIEFFGTLGNKHLFLFLLKKEKMSKRPAADWDEYEEKKKREEEREWERIRADRERKKWEQEQEDKKHARALEREEKNRAWEEQEERRRLQKEEEKERQRREWAAEEQRLNEKRLALEEFKAWAKCILWCYS